MYSTIIVAAIAFSLKLNSKITGINPLESVFKTTFELFILVILVIASLYHLNIIVFLAIAIHNIPSSPIITQENDINKV